MKIGDKIGEWTVVGVHSDGLRAMLERTYRDAYTGQLMYQQAEMQITPFSPRESLPWGGL